MVMFCPPPKKVHLKTGTAAREKNGEEGIPFFLPAPFMVAGYVRPDKDVGCG